MKFNLARFGDELRPYLPVLTLVALSFAVYSNSLFNQFVYDDIDQVTRNIWIMDFRHIPDILTGDVWGFKGENPDNYYRPLMHLMYMADYYLFGLNPWGFHLTNLLLHCGVTVLFYFLSKRLLTGAAGPGPSSWAPASFVAAAIFAVHPVHTEAVTWVAGLPEVSFVFFYLGSLLLYIRALDKSDKVSWLSVSLFFVSCFCKETALTLPLLIMCYEHFYRRSGEKPVVYIKRYVPYFLVVLAYSVIRFSVLGGLAPLRRHAEITGYELVINVFPLFGKYVYKMLLPFNLNAFHVFHPIHSLAETRGILSLAFALCFSLAAFIAARRNKKIFLGLAFIVIPLLPVFYIAGLGENTFAERYLYLPSCGFAMLIGMSFGSRLERPSQTAAAVAAVVLILCAYSAGTVSRNTVWKNGNNLWVDTVEKSPDARLPHLNLGVEYHSQGRLDEAMEQYLITLDIEPSSSAAHNGLGVIYADRGAVDNAIEEYITALGLKPDYSEAHNNLGTALNMKGLPDEALREYREAIRINPANAKAHNNLGVLYADMGLLDEAIEEYMTALELDQKYPDAHNNLGIAYFTKGQLDKAEKEHLAAIGLEPSHANAHYRLGLVYKNTDRLQKAIAEYQTAIKLQPHSAMYNNLGNTYMMTGQTKLGIEQYEKALELDPGNELARHNIESALQMKASETSTQKQ